MTTPKKTPKNPTAAERLKSAERTIGFLLAAVYDADGAAGFKPAWTQERPAIQRALKWLSGEAP